MLTVLSSLFCSAHRLLAISCSALGVERLNFSLRFHTGRGGGNRVPSRMREGLG